MPLVTAGPHFRQIKWLLAIIGVVLFLVIYLMRLDRVVGMFMDDAWYALLARSLATGQGYQLINSPTPGIAPLYPPLYPLLLSVAFKFYPQFPNNILLLKAVSVIAMLLAGVATCFYLVRYRKWQGGAALLVGIVTVLHPGLVSIATSSLMSECVFTLVQMLALVAVEHCVNKREAAGGWWRGALAGLLCSAVFLTRSMGIGLIAAALLYLLKERLFRPAAALAVCVLIVLGGWTLYTQTHKPGAEQRAEVNSYIVRPYSEQFRDRLAGDESQGQITLGDLPARVQDNLSSIAGRDAGGILLPSFYPALNQGLGEYGNGVQLILSLLACLLTITGYVVVAREKITMAEIALPFSLAIIIAWPFPPYRFLLPSLPLLLLYFLRGVGVCWRLHQRFSGEKEQVVSSGVLPWGALNGAAVVLVTICLFGNGSYLLRKYADNSQERPRMIRVFAEQEAILKWTAENVPQTETVLTTNPALVYLYTGHHTTTYNNPEAQWSRWIRMGVRYLVLLTPTRLPDPNPSDRRYHTIFRGGGEFNQRVDDLGPPSGRQDWNSLIEPPRYNVR
ncbi:MAG: hypothetical protein U0Z53_25075 [Blastocatellia bacterium]